MVLGGGLLRYYIYATTLAHRTFHQIFARRHLHANNCARHLHTRQCTLTFAQQHLCPEIYAPIIVLLVVTIFDKKVRKF